MESVTRNIYRVWVEAGFYLPEYDCRDFDTIPVPSCWAVLGYEEPVYRGFQNDMASEGLYVHHFVAPERFKGKKVNLHFGGVWASAEVWLNGKWLGRHDSGYTSFVLDASGALASGKDNVLAVRVRQVYPGYKTDTFDDWTLGGIFRDVVLEAMPSKRWMEGLTVVTDFDDDYVDADMTIKVMVNDRHKTILPGNYRSPSTPYQMKYTLRNAQGEVVAQRVSEIEAHASTGRELVEKFRIKKPIQWNAENPYLYSLEVNLLEKGEVAQTQVQKVGFREISTQGGVFRINGQAVKLRGVNYHDEHPDVGRATTREHWLADLLLMKACNINYIRACHYQHAKGIIELCDSLGMYVGAEVSLGGAGDLMLSPWFTGLMMQRVTETVTRDINNPSIVYWSIGNEDALTSMFLQGAKLAKALDSTRPVLLPWNADETLPEEIDILAPHYWTAAQYDSIASRSSRPIITTEYVHAYGNQRFGGLEDCWNALHRHEAGAGGAVWMWADQGLKTPTRKDMKRFGSIEKDNPYLRIGPEGWDGITDSYRKPTRDYWEVKSVYAPMYPTVNRIACTSRDKAVDIPIHNDYDFASTADVEIEWQLFVDERMKDNGKTSLDLKPHDTAPITLPISKIGKMNEGETAYFRLTFKKGDAEIASRTVELKNGDESPVPRSGSVPVIEEANDAITVSVGDRRYLFSRQSGLPMGIFHGRKKMIDGVRPTVWHKLNDGDLIIKNRSFKDGANPTQYIVSVNDMKTVAQGDSVIVRSDITCRINEDNHIHAVCTFTINKLGVLHIAYSLTPVMQTNYLPIIGMAVNYPEEVKVKRWLGLGPGNTYPNKKAGALLGVWDDSCLSGTHAARWVEMGCGKSIARISRCGYMDWNEETPSEIRILSQVLGRSEKGRLNDETYRVYPHRTYQGEFTID